MIFRNAIQVSEGIDINETTVSKNGVICRYY